MKLRRSSSCVPSVVFDPSSNKIISSSAACSPWAGIQSITRSRSRPSCTITSSRLITGGSFPLCGSTVTTICTGIPTSDGDCCAGAFATVNANNVDIAKVRRRLFFMSVRSSLCFRYRCEVNARVTKRRPAPDEDVSCSRLRHDSRAQRPEAYAKFFTKQLWLFPCSKVPTFEQPVVMDEFGIRFLRPTTRRRIEFVRKDAHRDRDLDTSRVEEATCRMVRIVAVELSRGDRSVRQPIKRDVVENVVPCQPLSLAFEHTRNHLFTACVVVDHPSRQSDRRIDDPVQRLWTIVHLDGVTEAILVREVQLIPRLRR